jgi:PAS domain S-box-containing protein
VNRVRLLDLGAFAGYFVLAAYLGRQAVVEGSALSLVWPAAGVAAAWLAVTGWQRWVALDATVVFALTLGVYAAVGASPGVTISLAVATVVQTLVFGFLISRWVPSWWGFGSEPPPGVQRLRDLGYLLVAALAGAAVSSLIGPISLLATTDSDWTVLLSWTVRNSVGIIAIFPLSLLARHAARADSPDRSPTPFGPYRGSVVEFVALVVVSAGACWLIFGVNDVLPIPFLLLATSVWAGTRFSPWVADLHALLLATGVVTFTVLGRGPFAAITDPVQQVLVVQAYVAVAVVLTLSLSVGRRESLALHQRLETSEHAATEQALMMRTIVDTVTDGLSVVDAQGRVLVRNPAAGTLVGDVRANAEGVLDAGGYDLRHPDGSSVTVEEYRAAFAGQSVDMDLFVRNADAPDGRMLEVTARPIPGSRPPLVVVVFHDVTAVRRERDELASFAGVVAHDLLNPLTVVEGWSETMLETARDGIAVPPDKQADQLERIVRAAQRMQHLISDLLAYTTARDLRITPVRVDLRAMVQDIARARVEASRVSEAPQPVITIDPALPDVLAEPVLLRQVIDNLVGNAVKYVAPGVCPEIDVRARQVDGDTGPMVRIEISDNGIGIPADQQARVFDTFHRAHREGYRGTGLGLSIVKRIAERHGGTATASDNAAAVAEGRTGSTMTVTFPAADQA